MYSRKINQSGQIGEETHYVHELKESLLFKLILSFNTVPIKIQEGHFVNVKELILTSVWEGSCPQIAKTILKRNQLG